jgi:hypothetical protein
MCEPVSIGVALTAASGALDAYQGQQAANAQNAANRQNLKATTQQAHAAALDEFSAIEERRTQLRAKAGADIQTIVSDSTRAQAQVLNELNGASGNSAAALLRDFERQEATFIESARGGLAQEERNLFRESKGTRAREAGRIAAATRPKIQGPLRGLNLVSTGLGIASDSFSAAQQIKGAGTAGATSVEP